MHFSIPSIWDQTGVSSDGLKFELSRFLRLEMAKWAVNGKIYIHARDGFKFNDLSISGYEAEPAVGRSPLGATYYGSDVFAVIDSWVFQIKSVRFDFCVHLFSPRNWI